jgi:hypothetical protein
MLGKLLRKIQTWMRISDEGAHMTKFLILTASTFAFASAAVAADLPTRQPPPPTPVVGKAPVGKLPIPIIGKLPIGKGVGKNPPPPPPVVARG